MSQFETHNRKPIDSDRKERSVPDHNEIFSNVIDQHVDALYNFTRREIAYHIATGDLLPDVITADGVVAAVVWRAQREFAKQPDGSNIRAWLIGLALEEVDLEVTRSKRVHERTTRVANDQPDTLPADVAFALGDEIPDFFQPDPDVPTKGFVARTSQATPEQTLAADQRGRLIIRVLRALPRAHRLAFVLRFVEGLAVDDITRVINRSEFETKRNLE